MQDLPLIAENLLIPLTWKLSQHQIFIPLPPNVNPPFPTPPTPPPLNNNFHVNPIKSSFLAAVIALVPFLL